jgi:hypothetical protein
MRAGTVCMVTAALVFGMGVGRVGGQQPTSDSSDINPKPGWWARLFGKKADAPHPGPAQAATSKEQPRPLTGADLAAAMQARERALLDRRQAVCDKLKEIALRTGDEALMRRAEQLDQRAWALYQRRTSAPAVPAGFQSDEQTLKEHLGGGPRATEDAPAPPNLTLRALEDGSGRTAARKEQP